MRQVLSVLLLAVSAFVLACSSGNDDSDRLAVVATTTQIGDFARNVGGDRISLTVLLDPDQDAHDFTPSPSQVRRLTEADLVLRNGVGLDFFVTKALDSGSNVVIVSKGAALRGAPDDEHEPGHEDDEDAAEADGNDPHVWFSIANAKVMVENVRDALADADAPNSSFYVENAARYLASLDNLDTEIRNAVISVQPSCRKLVTNHDVLGYYAEAYGFTVVGSVIPGTSTESRPSAAAVAEIVRRIRDERVPAIFAEASVNSDLVRQVAREANIRVVDDLYADSLGPSNSDGNTYIKMMQTNTKKIVDALKGC